MFVLVIIILSIAFQLAAALMALRLIRITGHRSAWILIAFAMVLQAARRVITLTDVLTGDVAASQVLFSEAIGLVLSVLMFVGVAYIGPFFRAIQTSIIAQKKAEEGLLQSNRELRTISQTNQALLRATEEQPLVNDVCNIVYDAAGYRVAWVGMIEHDEAKTIRPLACRGVDSEILHAKHITWNNADGEDNPIGSAVSTDKICFIQDIDSVSHVTPWFELAKEQRCRSFAVLPLADRDKVFGVLNVYATKVNVFTSAEVRMLEELAGDLAFGISDLHQRMERKRAEEALKRAEENYRNSLDDSPHGIAIINDEGEIRYANRALLEIYGYSSLKELSEMPRTKLYTPESYAEHRTRVEKRNRGEYVPSTYETNIIRKTGEVRQLQVSRKELLWDGKRQFQTIYQDVTERKKAEEKLQKTLDGVVKTIAMTVETRDPYTAGHQRRVAQLGKAIALEIGLDEDQANGIYIAGLLHDIGKISTPAEILSKPSKLNSYELGLIKSHAEAGYDILKNIDFPYPLARCALEHHERINGSGYPLGLAGDNICLEARILAVADVVEAMASHRPYRPSLGIDRAIDEISKNSGILYDSNLVEACLRLLKNKQFSFELQNTSDEYR